jgi:hypothetical protein
MEIQPGICSGISRAARRSLIRRARPCGEYPMWSSTNPQISKFVVQARAMELVFSVRDIRPDARVVELAEWKGRDDISWIYCLTETQFADLIWKWNTVVTANTLTRRCTFRECMGVSRCSFLISLLTSDYSAYVSAAPSMIFLNSLCRYF